MTFDLSSLQDSVALGAERKEDLFPVQAYKSLTVAATGLPGAEAILMVQMPIRN